MQSRLGPAWRPAPTALLQLLAEVGEVPPEGGPRPAEADRVVFKAAPFVVLMSTFLLYAAIPCGPDAWFADLDTGVFFVLAVSSLSVIGVLMAGWASANKYALIGGLRAAGQLIAYELPMVLAVVGVVIQAGTLNLNGIVDRAGQRRDLRARRPRQPLHPHAVRRASLIFLTAVQAELTQTPFDMPVAESELVARLPGRVLRASGSCSSSSASSPPRSCSPPSPSVLFLGGWYLPVASTSTSDAYWTCSARVLFAKIMLVSFLIFWVRFTYPRFREDQLQKFAWKYLIPISLVNIVWSTAVLKVVLF